MSTHTKEAAEQTVAEMLRRVLEWPNPNGTIEQYYLPPWLAQQARSALTASEAPATEQAPPLHDFREDGCVAMLQPPYAAVARAALSTPPAVPPKGWREFIEECATFAGKMVNGNRLSMQAKSLISAAPAAPQGEQPK